MSHVEVYAALADATRARMVEMLNEKPRPVHELAAEFDISRPAISRHLRVLKEAGLVREVKQGRENVYSLQRPKLKPAAEWLEKHRQKPAVARATPRAVAKAPRQPPTGAAKPAARPVAPATPQMELDF